MIVCLFWSIFNILKTSFLLLNRKGGLKINWSHGIYFNGPLTMDQKRPLRCDFVCVYLILIILELKRFEPSLVEFDNEQEVKTLFDDGRFFAWFRKNDFRNVPNILEYLLWNIQVKHIEHHHYHSITRISKYINID